MFALNNRQICLFKKRCTISVESVSERQLCAAAVVVVCKASLGRIQ